MLPDTIWNRNRRREISEKGRAIKLAPKEGRGRPCQQSRGAEISHEPPLLSEGLTNCPQDGTLRRVGVHLRGRMATRGYGATLEGLAIPSEAGQDDNE